MPDRPPIGDHAVLGDCSACVLVTRDGSIDWAAMPQFDSPPLFSGILDARRAGQWWIRPRGIRRTTRRYVPCTNVLETTFHAEGGCVRVTDFMPVASPESYGTVLRPDHQILRRIECVEGECEVETEGRVRPDFGRGDAHLRSRDALGIFGRIGSDAINLRSDLPLHLDGDTFRGRATLTRGEVAWMALSLTTGGEPAALAWTGELAENALEQTITYWQDWVGQMQYAGDHRNAVVRSALTLKLLTFAPSGAIVAAPTTSLPERIGGDRNWDYRYCWLRDASLTVRALMEIGYLAEAEAFISWVLHAGRRSLPRLRVLYDLYGNEAPHETELEGLEGYAGSQPVRVGNDASSQRQLDVYGTVISAARELWRYGHELGSSAARMLEKIADRIEELWDCPDQGIWESRAGPRRHTLSACMCAIGLEAVADLADADVVDVDAARLRSVALRIRRDVEAHGWNERIGSYVSFYGGEHVDASLLLLALRGYLPADHPRMRSTFAHLERELAKGPLWYRYRRGFPDGVSEGEGTFGLASFWAVEVLALSGEEGRARRQFEELLGYASDLGLFAEEIDADTGEQLGNFPQAYTHLGIVNAAVTLAGPEEARQPHHERKRGRRHPPSEGQELGT